MVTSPDEKVAASEVVAATSVSVTSALCDDDVERY